ncbi:hypothetical protein N7495_009301 [Penicillium taxi]|uniref:uncharacterized protein n=1 Tax=Penicillium taxi TaxID=168475 RepID=UPI0025458497|nr:uncharacterized protein N7495_009301 [Penicillium taxi]KAJ5884791.1 hypothetical protein N7495_009301 [Penicillium taxi]
MLSLVKRPGYLSSCAHRNPAPPFMAHFRIDSTVASAKHRISFIAKEISLSTQIKLLPPGILPMDTTQKEPIWISHALEPGTLAAIGITNPLENSSATARN